MTPSIRNWHHWGSSAETTVPQQHFRGTRGRAPAGPTLEPEGLQRQEQGREEEAWEPAPRSSGSSRSLTTFFPGTHRAAAVTTFLHLHGLHPPVCLGKMLLRSVESSWLFLKRTRRTRVSEPGHLLWPLRNVLYLPFSFKPLLKYHFSNQPCPNLPTPNAPHSFFLFYFYSTYLFQIYCITSFFSLLSCLPWLAGKLHENRDPFPSVTYNSPRTYNSAWHTAGAQ